MTTLIKKFQSWTLWLYVWWTIKSDEAMDDMKVWLRR